MFGQIKSAFVKDEATDGRFLTMGRAIGEI
ncbi:MAG: hypothetical protein N838_11770 [Thiohalocapsa sp. PB-PSB1]|nr:MAG: hypothetical protein N838_11770 [Thiohalocapsa sp. PB-PSB1]